MCTVHYVQWNAKKSIDLSSYVEEPSEPINISANSEEEYMERMDIKKLRQESRNMYRKSILIICRTCGSC